MGSVSEGKRLADEAILTIAEACELLKLSERSVRQKVSDGTLKTVDLGDRCAVRIINPLREVGPGAACEEAAAS